MHNRIMAVFWSMLMLSNGLSAYNASLLGKMDWAMFSMVWFGVCIYGLTRSIVGWNSED